jgi:hypothetical protein
MRIQSIFDFVKYCSNPKFAMQILAISKFLGEKFGFNPKLEQKNRESFGWKRRIKVKDFKVDY